MPDMKLASLASQDFSSWPRPKHCFALQRVVLCSSWFQKPSGGNAVGAGDVFEMGVPQGYDTGPSGLRRIDASSHLRVGASFL